MNERVERPPRYLRSEHSFIYWHTDKQTSMIAFKGVIFYSVYKQVGRSGYTSLYQYLKTTSGRPEPATPPWRSGAPFGNNYNRF